MPISAKIQRLKEDHDLQGLFQALRHPTDFILRRDAAQALGELNDLSVVEGLIRSTLEDPDPNVKKAARTALDELIGSEAELAISSYRSGPPNPDPWLKDFAGATLYTKERADIFSISSSDHDKIRSLKADHDLDGLVHWLRNPIDPLNREEAAIALGELGDLKAVDALIRAHLEDPNEEVQEIAYEALESLVGAQVDLAVSTYRSGPADTDSWLLDYSDEKGEEPGEDEDWEEVPSDELMEYLADDQSKPEIDDEVDLEQVKWDRQNLDGLIAVLRNEKDPNLRMRAIQALQHSSNIHAISFLAQTALYNDDEELRIAAKTALHNRFGDDADGLIESYRDATLEAEDDETEVEEGEDAVESTDAEKEFPQSAPVSTFSHQPAIHEDKMGWRFILALVLVIVAAAVIIILLSSR